MRVESERPSSGHHLDSAGAMDEFVYPILCQAALSTRTMYTLLQTLNSFGGAKHLHESPDSEDLGPEFTSSNCEALPIFVGAHLVYFGSIFGPVNNHEASEPFMINASLWRITEKASLGCTIADELVFPSIFRRISRLRRIDCQSHVLAGDGTYSACLRTAVLPRPHKQLKHHERLTELMTMENI